MKRLLTWLGLHSWWLNPIAFGPEFGCVVYECRWCGRVRYDRSAQKEATGESTEKEGADGR